VSRAQARIAKTMCFIAVVSFRIVMDRTPPRMK
jgi:hypothetical protein